MSSSLKTSTKVDRKLRICAGKKCTKCPLQNQHPPEDCEWILKHALDAEDEGVVINAARRSGKTTDLIRRAMKMMDDGYEVIILVPNTEVAYQMQQKLMVTGIDIMPTGGWGRVDKAAVDRALRGRDPSLVYSDEIGEWLAHYVNNGNKHRFMLGYETK